MSGSAAPEAALHVQPSWSSSHTVGASLGPGPGAWGMALSGSGQGRRADSSWTSAKGPEAEPQEDLEKGRGVSGLFYYSFLGQTAGVIWGEGEKRG